MFKIKGRQVRRMLQVEVIEPQLTHTVIVLSDGSMIEGPRIEGGHGTEKMVSESWIVKGTLEAKQVLITCKNFVVYHRCLATLRIDSPDRNYRLTFRFTREQGKWYLLTELRATR